MLEERRGEENRVRVPYTTICGGILSEGILSGVKRKRGDFSSHKPLLCKPPSRIELTFMSSSIIEPEDAFNFDKIVSGAEGAKKGEDHFAITETTKIERKPGTLEASSEPIIAAMAAAAPTPAVESGSSQFPSAAGKPRPVLASASVLAPVPAPHTYKEVAKRMLDRGSTNPTADRIISTKLKESSPSVGRSTRPKKSSPLATKAQATMESYCLKK